MGKIWVLDTETKGTGAEMVPLERVLEKRPAPSRESERRRAERVRRLREPKPEPRVEERAPREPSRFKVVSALSGRLLADDADAREAVDALAGLRSIADARVYVREAGDWRPLTLSEQRLLWEYRRRVAA